MHLKLVIKMSVVNVFRSYFGEGIIKKSNFGSTLSTVREHSTFIQNHIDLVSSWMCVNVRDSRVILFCKSLRKNDLA